MKVNNQRKMNLAKVIFLHPEEQNLQKKLLILNLAGCQIIMNINSTKSANGEESDVIFKKSGNDN